MIKIVYQQLALARMIKIVYQQLALARMKKLRKSGSIAKTFSLDRSSFFSLLKKKKLKVLQ